MLPYEAGTISLGGTALPPRERASRIFYLPDAIASWPAQTVRCVLDFTMGLFGRGGSRAELNARRDDVVERLDLGPLLGSPIGTLSKGQRKRAVLAIGMLISHPVLLADEPFDGLDLRQTCEVGAALRAHAATGRTLFLSIHQIGDAARVCDRFVLLSVARVVGHARVDRAWSRRPTRRERVDRRATRPRVHARQRARPGAQRRRPEPGFASREQRSSARRSAAASASGRRLTPRAISRITWSR